MGNCSSSLGLQRKSRKRSCSRKSKRVAKDANKSLPDLVLFKIFCKLDWDQLKICRLICRQWDNLLRETTFADNLVVLQFPPLTQMNERFIPKWMKHYQENKPIKIMVSEPKLKFSTMRFGNSSRVEDTAYNFPNNSKLLKGLSAMKPTLKYVTRLEVETCLIPKATSRTDRMTTPYEQQFDSKINLWNDLLSNFENIKELILSHLGNYKNKNINQQYFAYQAEIYDLESVFYTALLGAKLERLKNLEKFVYCVDNPSPNEFFLFLKLIANSCHKLKHFQIHINYDRIYTSEFAQKNLFPLLGEIVKKNALTLKNLIIGNRNAAEDEDVRNIYLQRREWLHQFSGYNKNRIFEKLMDEMLNNKWDQFELNVLSQLTLEFPQPILPTPKIESILKKFIDSLGNLKSVKIQPIIGWKILENPGFVPMPYIEDVFKNSEVKFYPKIESDQVFFSQDIEFHWCLLRTNCQRSVVDLILKPSKASPSEGYRNIRWRNACWENVSFESSMIVQHLQFLTQLIIFQHQQCRSIKFLKLDDSDFQLILKNGNFLRNLTISCDLSQVTCFGFSGMGEIDFEFLKNAHPKKLNYSAQCSLEGFSIFRLKELNRLVLTMLSGHYPVQTEEVPTEVKQVDLEFLLNYFSSSNQLKDLIIGYEGLYDSRPRWT